MSGDLIGSIRRSRRVSDLLYELSEFHPISEAPPDWFALSSGEPLQVIGRDGSGGRFAQTGDFPTNALLYVGSEGQAGVIASTLVEGIQLMIALPYWRDCLHFSGGGDLHEMREAQALLERDLRADRPDLDDLREELYSALGLEVPDSPLEKLHGAVRDGTRPRVISPGDGSEYASLFNTFTVGDNPMWRQ